MDSKIKKIAAGVALAGALTVGTAGARSPPTAQYRHLDPVDAGNQHPPAYPSGVPSRRSQGCGRHARRESPGSPDCAEGRPDDQRVHDLRGARTAGRRRHVDQRCEHEARPARGCGQVLAGSGRLDHEQARQTRIDTLMNHHFGQHASA